MQICCSICKDIFIHHSEVVVTECGHLYHNLCVSEWFKNHSTCPQCRANVKKNKVHRVYFDVENDTDVDPSSLLYKVDKLLYDLQVKEGDIKKLNDKVSELEKQNASLRDRVREGEKEVQTHKQTVYVLKNQMRCYNTDTEVYNQMKKDYEVMERKVKTLQMVDRLIQGTVEEVSAMVSNTEVTPLAVRHLCTFVEALKLESKKLQSRKDELAAELRSVKKELQNVNKEKTMAEEQVEILSQHNSQLQEDLNHYIKLSQQQPKLDSTIDLKTPSPKKAKLCNSNALAKPKENEFEMSIIDIASPFPNFPGSKKSLFSLDKKIINNLDVKKIQSSNDLDFDLDIVPGPIRKLNKPLSISNDVSIFRNKLPANKKATETDSFSRSNKNFVFDGMGGSKKVSLAQPTPKEELRSAVLNREALKKKQRKVSKPASAVAPKGVVPLDNFFSRL